MASLRARNLLLGLVALWAAVFALPGSASAHGLGTVGSAPASCPQGCLVEAWVTGFQLSSRLSRNPFVTPAAGKIVSWSIDLGMPHRTDIKTFNRKFGESKARISVLKRVRDRRRRVRYLLLRESPVQRLRPHFGRLASFTLDRPLKIGRRQIIALTIPPWAPAFAVDGLKQSRWLASRRPTRRRGGCFASGGFANLAAGSAHQKLRTARAYRCTYHGARLLYSANFVHAR